MHDFSGHEHTHIHENVTAFESTEQAVTLLKYMLDHNKAHAEELHEICHKLEVSGAAEASFLIDDAVEHFREGNELLESALQSLQKQSAETVK